MIALEALARWPLLRQSLVHLHSVSIGPSTLVSLLPGGARLIGHVHWYHHIVHPWWGIGQGHLSWCEASCGLGVSWLEVQLAVIVAEALEVRCILYDRVDQLH